MSPATKEPTEVYYPQWVDTRLAHMADAVEAAARMIRREDTFIHVMEGHPGDGESTRGAREVRGAERVLEDVHERLTAIRVNPSEYANETDGLTGELWDASYRLSSAAVTLREHDGQRENAPHLTIIIETLADGLEALGSLTDERQGRKAKGGES